MDSAGVLGYWTFKGQSAHLQWVKVVREGLMKEGWMKVNRKWRENIGGAGGEYKQMEESGTLTSRWCWLNGLKAGRRVMQCTFGVVDSIESAEVLDSPWKFLNQGERMKLKRWEQKASICLLESLRNKEAISWIPFNTVKWK